MVIARSLVADGASVGVLNTVGTAVVGRTVLVGKGDDSSVASSLIAASANAAAVAVVSTSGASVSVTSICAPPLLSIAKPIIPSSTTPAIVPPIINIRRELAVVTGVSSSKS